MTEALKRERRALGSRLHRDDDGTWLAYAQWPSREAWERSGSMQSPDPGSSKVMGEAIAERIADAHGGELETCLPEHVGLRLRFPPITH